MQSITNPSALELSEEVRKTVAPNRFVNETIDRESEWEQLRIQLKRWQKQKEQELEQELKQKLTQERELAQSAKQKTTERMIIIAIHNKVSSEVIEDLCREAGITESRLAELKEQAR